MYLYLPYGETWMDEGVVVHVQGGEVLSCEVRDSKPEIIVTICDEASLLTIRGIIDRKLGIAAITVSR